MSVVMVTTLGQALRKNNFKISLTFQSQKLLTLCIITTMESNLRIYCCAEIRATETMAPLTIFGRSTVRQLTTRQTVPSSQTRVTTLNHLSILWALQSVTPWPRQINRVVQRHRPSHVYAHSQIFTLITRFSTRALRHY